MRVKCVSLNTHTNYSNRWHSWSSIQYDHEFQIFYNKLFETWFEFNFRTHFFEGEKVQHKIDHWLANLIKFNIYYLSFEGGVFWWKIWRYQIVSNFVRRFNVLKNEMWTYWLKFTIPCAHNNILLISSKDVCDRMR